MFTGKGSLKGTTRTGTNLKTGTMVERCVELAFGGVEVICVGIMNLC